MCIDLFGGPPNNSKNNPNKLFKKKIKEIQSKPLLLDDLPS